MATYKPKRKTNSSGTTEDIKIPSSSIDGIDNYSLDSSVVHKTGDESISGTKTFATRPKVGSMDVATTDDIGAGTITINQDGTLKGTFTVNQTSNTTIDLDSGSSGTSDHASLTNLSYANSGHTGFQAQIQFVILGDDD